jgi:hypothetical protein
MKSKLLAGSGFLLSSLILFVCVPLALVSVFDAVVAVALCLPCQSVQAQVLSSEMRTHRSKDGSVTREALLQVSYVYAGSQRSARVTAPAAPREGTISVRVSGWFPQHPLAVHQGPWANLFVQCALASVWIGCGYFGWFLLRVTLRDLRK